MYRFDTPRDELDSVRRWFAGWGACVAAGDFDGARTFFDAAALGFGTWMDMLEGLDRLEAEQWRSIWPNLRAFHHYTDTLRVAAPPDRDRKSARTGTSVARREDLGGTGH